MRKPFTIREHQDFLEVIDADGKSTLVADRSVIANAFLIAAVAALNAA